MSTLSKDNGIGNGGVQVLCPLLKNCSLKNLNLACKTQEMNEEAYSFHLPLCQCIVNGITDDGFKALSDSLKTNTTLTVLKISGFFEKEKTLLFFVFTKRVSSLNRKHNWERRSTCIE